MAGVLFCEGKCHDLIFCEGGVVTQSLKTTALMCTLMGDIAKLKSSLYSPYYAEACNELRGPSPRLSAWATQLRRNVATVANRWRHCVDLTGPGIEPQTSRTDSVRLATELTAGSHIAKLAILKHARIVQQKNILNERLQHVHKISTHHKEQGFPTGDACTSWGREEAFQGVQNG